MRSARTALGIVALSLAPASLAAQDTVMVGVRTTGRPGDELPAAVARSLEDFYNRSTTIRFSGRTRVPAGRTIAGDVAVLGGPVELAGVIDGDMVVLNGDLTLRPGSRIDGDLTLVGGIAIGVENAEITGVITTYTAVFRYRRTADGIEYLGAAPERGPRPRGRRLVFPRWTLGDSEIHISARPYNRIEALPIAIGPRITSGGRNPLRFEALLVYRTQAGFEPQDDDLGYEVNARQYLGGHRDLWIEGGVQSVIAPIESWQLTNLENSLALFLFRRDYRDYYERQGWFGRFGWQSSSFFGALEFIDESQRNVETRPVWTILFNTEDDHQPNAAINSGDLQSVTLTLGVDTRNDRDDPWAGWYNRLLVERAVGGDLGGESPDFTRLFLDFRRYMRVSRGSMIALRAVGGGRLGDQLLPAQRQHVIGGVGSLPGYDQQEFDCGARAGLGFSGEPGYGCQRFALFQAEYRSGLDFHWHWDHRQVPDDDEFYGDIFSVDFSPSAVLFYDAGAAWNSDEGFFDHLTISDNWVADVGGGIDFGGLGLYVAYPLVGSGGFNFFVRLSGRF